MIIGITGLLASGKNEAAQYLQSKHQFAQRSYGDMIRAELTEIGTPLGRDTEFEHGNRQRQQFGPAYWSKKILDSIIPDQNVVIEGIRNLSELALLESQPNFHLIAVEAPLEVRFKRLIDRAKTGDPITLEQMKAKEDREAHSDDPTKQSIADCMKRAQFHVDNSSNEQHLHLQLDQIINQLRK